MFYVYCIQSLDDESRFYIGSTSDLRRRLKEHNTGENRSIKNHRWRVVYYESYLNDKSARIREQRLKKHGKTKQALMQRIKESLTLEEN